MIIKDWTSYYSSLSKAEIKAPYSFNPDGAIEESGLEGALLVDGAVTTTKIQDAAITNAKIKEVSADKITTSTLTAQVNVGTGTGFVKLDGANNRIIVNDGVTNRIVIGSV